jgi:hypothetical protein
MRKSHGATNRVLVSLLLAALSSLLFLACGEDGESPLCPKVRLYDIGAAGERNDPELKAEQAAAIDAGCMTPPMTAEAAAN